MKNILTFLLVFQSLFVVCQEDDGYFEGTIAKSKIYLSIHVFGDAKEEPNTI